MLRHLARYNDECLCCVVDAKLKVAKDGYCIATFGILTKDILRKTTLARASTKATETARTQSFAYTSHNVPGAQALFHQETDRNFQHLFRAVDELWQNSASPSRAPLAQMSFQLHKDFKKEIESARLACFPLSRGCDDFFHFSQKQHTTMAAKCSKTILKNGKWVKAHLNWALAVLRILRLVPTLPLFSRLWNAFLAHLTEEQEIDLVAWLRSYERPLPHALQQKYAAVSPALTYVSLWTGLDGIVPGSGAGSQPAEALHAPWQRQLEALGGAGDVGHVLTVMQNLYPSIGGTGTSGTTTLHCTIPTECLRQLLQHFLLGVSCNPSVLTQSVLFHLTSFIPWAWVYFVFLQITVAVAKPKNYKLGCRYETRPQCETRLSGLRLLPRTLTPV